MLKTLVSLLFRCCFVGVSPAVHLQCREVGSAQVRPGGTWRLRLKFRQWWFRTWDSHGDGYMMIYVLGIYRWNMFMIFYDDMRYVKKWPWYVLIYKDTLGTVKGNKSNKWKDITGNLLDIHGHSECLGFYIMEFRTLLTFPAFLGILRCPASF